VAVDADGNLVVVETDEKEPDNTREQGAAAVIIEQGVHWGAIDPGLIQNNPGPWSDNDWNYSKSQLWDWGDSISDEPIAYEDLKYVQFPFDLPSAGFDVELNGYVYTPQGMADLSQRTKEWVNNPASDFMSDTGYTWDDFTPTEQLSLVKSYEYMHGGDIQFKRPWHDYRGQGKVGLIKAVGRALTFQKGFFQSWDGHVPSMTDQGLLLATMHLNPATAGFYIAGRVAGGIFSDITGHAREQWINEGIELFTPGVGGSSIKAYWMQKFLPPNVPDMGYELNDIHMIGLRMQAEDTGREDDKGNPIYEMRMVYTKGTPRGGGRQEVYEETMDEFITRTGQVPRSLVSMGGMPEPVLTGGAEVQYEHPGEFLQEVFDLRLKDGSPWTPEYALVDVPDHMLAEGVERQFPGEQVVRLIDADNFNNFKIITLDEWIAVMDDLGVGDAAAGVVVPASRTHDRIGVDSVEAGQDGEDNGEDHDRLGT
jgi:hypothetical protein